MKRPYTEANAPFEGCRVYTTFHKKEDRVYCHVITPTGKRMHMTRARFRMQIKIGRLLSKSEQVDHVDEDRKNDKLNNLQVLSPGDNSRKHVTQSGKALLKVRLRCMCGKEFVVKAGNTSVGCATKKLPACSRSCGGKQRNSVVLEVFR